MAAQIPAEDRKKVTLGERTQWYFTKKIWLPEYTHAVRIVILWEHWNGKAPVKMLITNQTPWEVTRVLRGYGQRWTGTETLHRDGKQHLGLGDCQLRSGEGQTRPLPRAAGAQSAGRSVAPGPCACVGSGDADDHRRSLSGGVARDAGQDDHLGG